MRGHGDRQSLQRQRLLLHSDVAVRIGRGAANDADIDRKGLVEEIFLAIDFHQANDIARSLLVQLATAEARIDEGAQPDAGQSARLASGDVAKQMGDDSLRQVVGLDAIRDG